LAAVAYFDGEKCRIGGGTADPSAHTVSIAVQEFAAQVVTSVAIVDWVAAAGPAGLPLNRAVSWHYGLARETADQVSQGTAKAFIRPDDPVVAKWASLAMLRSNVSGELKRLDDPGFAEWVYEAVNKGEKPTLVFGEEPLATSSLIRKIHFNCKEGTNWQTAEHYFTLGSQEAGPLSGDCTDQTNMVVNIFRNRAFLARGVYANVGGNKHLYHAFAEVVIGGQLYRVNAYGELISPVNDEFSFREYLPVTSPGDPHYRCMWDENGQWPYDADWWKAPDLAGTYRASIKFPFADVPFAFNVEPNSTVRGEIEKVLAGVNVTGEPVKARVKGFSGGSVSKDGTLRAVGLGWVWIEGRTTKAEWLE